MKKVKTQKNQPKKKQFQKVLDTKGKPVTGLWQRNGRYYAQLTLKAEGRSKNTKLALKALNLTEAKARLEELKFKRANNQLEQFKKAPGLADYCGLYMVIQVKLKRKKASSLKSERGHIKHWQRLLGNRSMSKINASDIRLAMAQLREDGLAPQTINYALITLRNIFSMALEDGLISGLPFVSKMWLKKDRRKRPEFTTAQLDKLLNEAQHCSRNGRHFAWYFKFMCFSGARAGEALRVKWADVDFTNRQIVIGADGNTKNGKSRVVDFNGELEALLLEMRDSRLSDEWLFVSGQRGSEGQRARCFKETLVKARERVGLGQQRKAATGYALGFHDCRHYFISHAVMCGVDFPTVAIWVGHQDGGMLISTVYAHIANEHRKNSAAKVSFKPRLIDGGLDAGNQQSIAL